MPMRLVVLAFLLLLTSLASVPAESARGHGSDAIARQSVPGLPAFLAAQPASAVAAVLPESDGRGPADGPDASGDAPAPRGAVVTSCAALCGSQAGRLPPRLCERLPYDATAPPSLG